MIDLTFYNDETLNKVERALGEAGLDENRIEDAVALLQSEGILFRERIPDGELDYNVLENMLDKVHQEKFRTQKSD